MFRFFIFAIIFSRAASACAVSLELLEISGNTAHVTIWALPRTMKVGDIDPEGVKLLELNQNQAVFDVKGKKLTLKPSQSRKTLVLQADIRGHYSAKIFMNGFPIVGMIDTGATALAINSETAQQIGLDYRKGQPILSSTANGNAVCYQMVLRSFRMGDITLSDVSVNIIPGGTEKLQEPLIGMSVLGRLDMVRTGSSLTLSR